MRGVQFGDFHTSEDWDLILTEKTLTPPVPKTIQINIDGRDGALDLSEALTGEIKYENRTASFVFLLTEGTYEDREALITEILGVVHGRKLKITLPDNNDYYLIGRCEITDRSNNKALGQIAIECNCEPWFYANTETVRSVTVKNSSSTITLTNGGIKTVTPEVVVSGGSVTLSFNNSTVSLSAGTYKVSNLKLKSGSTILTVEGTGTVNFTYREGVL